jgi:hypothetical protein
MEVAMAITRSYNKHTNTYYAYETSYVWDEKTQKKVQKKRCIGKFDPETDEIIPNGKRGRPRRDPAESSAVEPDGQDRAKYAKTISEVKALSSRLKSAEESFEKLSMEFQSISTELANLLSEIQ